MSILSAIRQQSSSIDDLAKLPQAMIMQMAQRKQIAPEMVAPILSRKAEMIDAAAKVKALQGGVPQTSVMEQLMAQNATAEAPESSEMGVAQLPVPERQYAGGGIIAFAKGSLIDEDDEIDPYEDYAKAAAAVQRANAMPIASRQPSKLEAGISQIFPKSYEAALAEKGETPASIRKTAIEGAKPVAQERPRGGHKYEDMVVREAERLGVDPKLALHVLYKETGNLKNPETAKSPAGAIGVMQLMPKTAKGLGVDPLNPEENIRGGVTYLKQMYDKYQDPTLALAAYNAGPGRLDKALKSGQGLAALPRETQNYIRMAEGGEVKHFQYGGSTMGGFELENYPSEESVMSPEYQKYFKEYQKELEKKMKTKKDVPSSLQAPDLKTTPVEIKKTGDEDTSPYVDGKPPVKTAAEVKEPKSAFEMFLEQNAADRAALSKQRDEDSNMALLAAGLGMLGGESPYAFTNIGKGGLSGVSYLSEANKQRAAQQAALDKSRIAAMHYQNLGDYYKSGITSKEDKLASQQYDRAMSEITRINTAIENAAKNNVAQMKGIDTILDPAKLEMLVNRERARLQAIAEPQLRSLYKRADIVMPDFSPTSEVQSKADAILKGK
jgi:hypothetical protein